MDLSWSSNQKEDSFNSPEVWDTPVNIQLLINLGLSLYFENDLLISIVKINKGMGVCVWEETWPPDKKLQGFYSIFQTIESFERILNGQDRSTSDQGNNFQSPKTRYLKWLINLPTLQCIDHQTTSIFHLSGDICLTIGSKLLTFCQHGDRESLIQANTMLVKYLVSIGLIQVRRPIRRNESMLSPSRDTLIIANSS